MDISTEEFKEMTSEITTREVRIERLKMELEQKETALKAAQEEAACWHRKAEELHQKVEALERMQKMMEMRMSEDGGHGQIRNYYVSGNYADVHDNKNLKMNSQSL